MENNTSIALVFVTVPISTGGTFLASVYGSVIAMGLAANCWVARVLLDVLVHGKADAVPRSMLVLILALCASDLIVLYSLLLMLLGLILGEWVFGSLLCVCSITLEMANKFFTPFLLAVLSGTCYATISSAKTGRNCSMRQAPFAFKALVFISVAALLVATPAVFYARLFLTPQGVVPTGDGYLLPVLRKCGFYPPPKAGIIITTYGTFIGYVLPLSLFSFFYLKVALFVRSHNRTCSRRVPLCVGKMIFCLLSVYMFSWTPFWVGAWVVCLVRNPCPVVVGFVKVAHLLPYISCIVYPAIYTVMNRQLQNEHARLREARHQKRSIQSSLSSLRSTHSLLENRQMEKHYSSVGSSNNNHMKQAHECRSLLKAEGTQTKFKSATELPHLLVMGEEMTLFHDSQPNLALPAIHVTDCDQTAIN